MSVANEANDLAKLARLHLGNDLAERWVTTFAEATRLSARPATAGPDEQGPRGAPDVVGWLGGVPPLPSGTDWPAWDDFGPLSHVATLDCARLYPSVPVTVRAAGFPADGLLSFFYFDGSVDEDDEDVDAVSILYGTDDGARVVYTPPGVDTVEQIPPAPLEPYRRVDLIAETVLTYQDIFHPDLYVGGRQADGWKALFPALDDLRRQHPGPAHQVGGHPDPVQGPVDMEVSYGRLSHGGKLRLDWADPAIVTLAREWLLLAQFDSDDAPDFMWGDCGMLYFMIRPADLPRKDFAQVAFTWQCS